jgi:hypothetical protein
VNAAVHPEFGMPLQKLKTAWLQAKVAGSLLLYPSCHNITVILQPYKHILHQLKSGNFKLTLDSHIRNTGKKGCTKTWRLYFKIIFLAKLLTMMLASSLNRS